MMNLAFYMAVYDDQVFARRLILSLTRFFRGCKILVVADGRSTLQFEQFCIQYGCDYLDGERLKLSEFGGLWIQRMLQFYLSVSDSPFLIKLDADTKVLRPFENIPQADIFGSITNNGVKNYVQGGAIGIGRSAAQTILDSGLLLSTKYKGLPFSYRRYQPPYLQPGEVEANDRLIASDVVLSDVADLLGLDVKPWSEVCSFPTQSELESYLGTLSAQEIGSRYSILHPWKYEI